MHFPTAKKTILYLIGTMKECKKGIGEMMMVLCAGIQEKYGWLRPRSYDEEYFERNRKYKGNLGLNRCVGRPRKKCWESIEMYFKVDGQEELEVTHRLFNFDIKILLMLSKYELLGYIM